MTKRNELDVNSKDWLSERRSGTEVDLTKLLPGQRVGWGDGRTYHIVYAPRPRVVGAGAGALSIQGER